jgi:hypothetical protein
MNVSMADDPTFKKIKSSSYNNASEAVLLAGLAREQRESIQRLVRKRLESAGPTDFLEYTGRDGLRELAARVKARGRMKRYRALKAPSATLTPSSSIGRNEPVCRQRSGDSQHHPLR